MPKDTKKMAAARNRSQMSVRRGKAAAKVKAVRRAVNDALTERHTQRRKKRQHGRTEQ